MSRTGSALAALLLIAPLMFTGLASTGDPPAAPIPSPHEGSIRIDNLSAASLSNITLRPDGGAELSHAPGCWSNGFTIASAAYTQGQPFMTSNSRGEFIVTWQDDRLGNPKCIYMQRLDIAGNKLGGEVAVATGAGHKGGNFVCVDGKDNMIITWWDYRYGTEAKAFVKRYDPYGNLQGSEIQVSWAGGNQTQTYISSDREGNFIVTWSDDRLGIGNYDIYAQRYDFRGNRIGGEVLMCGAQNNQWGPTVLMLPEGGFLLAWGDGRTGSGYDVFMQKYDLNGQKVGTEIAVASGTGDEFPRKLLFDSDGNVVMCWNEYFNGVGSDLYIQRLDQNGTKLGNKIKVNDLRKAYYPPFIALDSLNNMMCVYGESSFQEYWLYSQMFDASGNRVGGTKELVHDTGLLGWLDIAADTKDNFLLVYGNGSSDLSGLPYLQPHFQEGGLVLGPLAPPDLWAWSNLSAGLRSAGPPGQSVDFDFSTDGGAGWKAVPANGSLASTGNAPGLRLRARLSTADLSTTPVLYNVTVRFVTNRLPTVTASPDAAAPKNTPVDLTATGSDPDSDGLTYLWSQTGGPPAQLSGAASSICSFTPNRSGVYSFAVRVNDGFNDSLPAPVNITVANRLPSVSSGPDLAVQKGGTAVMSATGTDPDGDALEFYWNQTAGTPRYLERTGGPEVSFPAWAAGRFTFRAVATDGEGESAPAFVNLTVWGRAPLAVLRVGGSPAGVGENVLFNASGSSDPDGNITGYNFRFGDGAESGWGTESAISHAYSSAGTYSATVAVRDDDGNESTGAVVNVSVVAAGAPRITISGPREGEVLSSRNVRVTFLVENFTVAAGAGHLHFKLDDQPEVMWYSTAPLELSNLSAGQHTLRAFLEDAGHTRLTGPGSSTAVSFSISYLGLPDLAVTASDITVSPAGAREGQTVTVSVRIYNIGQSDAGQFKVRFLVDGKALGDQTVLMLGKAANIERQAAWKAQQGAHEIRVLADPVLLINESDESNNEAAVTVNIASAKPTEKGMDPVWLVLIVVVIVVAAVGAAMLLRRKRVPGAAARAPPSGPAQPISSGQSLFPPAPPPPPDSSPPAPPPPTPPPPPPSQAPSLPQPQAPTPPPPPPPPPTAQSQPSPQPQTPTPPPPPTPSPPSQQSQPPTPPLPPPPPPADAAAPASPDPPALGQVAKPPDGPSAAAAGTPDEKQA